MSLEILIDQERSKPNLELEIVHIVLIGVVTHRGNPVFIEPPEMYRELADNAFVTRVLSEVFHVVFVVVIHLFH